MEVPAQDMMQKRTAGKALKRIFRQDDILSRIEEQPASFSMLMNPTRLRIFIQLCQYPCSHTRGLSRDLDISLTTINWHLGQLVEYGYIESKSDQGKRLYWPIGMLEMEHVGLIGCLQNDIPDNVLKTLSRSPGQRQMDMVSELNVRQQNLDFWLRRMQKLEIIERRGKGIGTTFYISGKLADIVESYDSTAKSYSEFLFNLFTQDGLRPIRPRFRGSRLGMDIRPPAGKRRIHLECSPLASIRRYMP